MIEKPHTVLIFKLQQEVLKFNEICVSWSSSKTDLVRNFLNLENRSFENVSFSQQYRLSKYLPFLYLITYLFLFLTYYFFSYPIISLIDLKNIH